MANEDIETPCSAPKARRVNVTDPVAGGRLYDYSDAFELRLGGPDPCSPEEWVRAGVEATPAWIKRVAGNAEGLGSARVVDAADDLVVLEDSDPLMDTVLVGRNVEPGRRVLTTLLRYRRPLLARTVWAVVGPLHRRTARRVVAGGLRARDRRKLALARSCGLAVPGILIGLAALHASWALGSTWPARSEEELADYVLSRDERDRLEGALPPAALTWAVALSLASAGAIVRAAATGTQNRGVRGASWALAAVLFARGVAYLPSDLTGGIGDPYRRLDLALYSPLCLGLAGGTALILGKEANR